MTGVEESGWSHGALWNEVLRERNEGPQLFRLGIVAMHQLKIHFYKYQGRP